LGLPRFRPDVARPFFAAAVLAFRVERLEDFVAVFLRFAADLDVFAAVLAGARFFAADVFAFVRRLVGWLLERLLRAAMTAPETAPITVPTTGVPTAVPTTAPATAPPSVLVAAPFSSLDKISFLSSSVMFDPSVTQETGDQRSSRRFSSYRWRRDQASDLCTWIFRARHAGSGQ
jgi:hypothetical protein